MCRAMGILGSHEPQSVLFERYAESLPSLYKFAFVRDPLSRFVSAYQWRQIEKELPEAEHSTDLRRLKGITIGECAAILVNEPALLAQHLAPQSQYIETPEKMDFIGRFENLVKDWQVICRAVRVNIPLPHLNKSVALDTIPDSVKDAVRELYADDYRKFGYPIPRGILHGATGIAKAITGTGGASEELVARRTAICNAPCEHAVTSLGVFQTCNLCGCSTWAKVRNATEKCPAGKW